MPRSEGFTKRSDLFRIQASEVTMSLTTKIQQRINDKNMLLHPFYQDWMKGELSRKQLQNYGEQYIPFTDDFPRFVSAIHSNCDSLEKRRLLLENLAEEEGLDENGPGPHQNLWRDFIDGIGGDSRKKGAFAIKSLALRDTYKELCQSSYEEGLCALYVYEHQIPKVAELKIEGLAQFYGITDKKALRFFTLHQKADVAHSGACEKLIDEIDEEKEAAALAAAAKAADSLWDFLSEAHAAE